MTIVVDRCLGRTLAEHLCRLGVDARWLDNYFIQNETDDKWLSDIGKQGWIVLTKDKRFRYNPLELDMLYEHEIGVIAIPNHMTSDQMCRLVESVLAEMLAMAARTTRPFVIHLSRASTLTVRPLLARPNFPNDLVPEGTVQAELPFDGEDVPA